jgi:hypothetical protein
MQGRGLHLEYRLHSDARTEGIRSIENKKNSYEDEQEQAKI